MIMAQFDRYAICLAYQALENDWNKGGWLPERPSNQRRRESIGVQLMRMQFRAGMSEGGTFDALDDEAREIYVGALVRFGMAPKVDPADELGAWVREYFVPEYVVEHFPQMAAGPGKAPICPHGRGFHCRVCYPH